MRNLYKAIFDEKICDVWGIEWAMIEGEWVIDEVTITIKGIFGALCVAGDSVILLQSTGFYLHEHLLFEGDIISSVRTGDTGFFVWVDGSWKIAAKDEMGIVHYIPLSSVLGDDSLQLVGNRFLGEDAYG